MASYNQLLIFFTLMFLAVCSAPTSRGSHVTLSMSEVALSNHIDKVSIVQHRLANMSNTYTKDKSLIACSDMVSKGKHLLDSVRMRMKGATQYDSETSSSLQTTFSAGLTYIRTCSRTLKRAKRHKVQRFANLVSHVDDVANICTLESDTLRAIARATVPTNSKKPEQGSPMHKLSSARKIKATLNRIPGDRRVVVAQDGTGDFRTISEAVEAAPTGATEYFLIVVKEGRYDEKVVIPLEKPFLVLAGAGKDRTVITGNRSDKTGWNTWDGATVAVFGHNFIGYNIGFENSAGPHDGRAAAMLCCSHHSVFYKCSFKSYQDTLFAHSWWQFYRECDIYGTVDFIFGDATTVFQFCNIFVRQPLGGHSAPIVAQHRDCTASTTGFTIQNSQILQERGHIRHTKTYLGRPWGKASRVAYLSNVFKLRIDPAGWIEMAGDPDKVYLGEYNNTGLDMLGRVNWRGVRALTTQEADSLTVDGLLGGGTWIDQTRVPYMKGL